MMVSVLLFSCVTCSVGQIATVVSVRGVDRGSAHSAVQVF